MRQIPELLNIQQTNSGQTQTEITACDTEPDYATLKWQFMEYGREYLRNTGRMFEIRKSDRELVNELFLYFMGRSTKYDSKKGLWLSGSIGVGKTTLMNAFRLFIDKQFGKTFRIYHYSEVATYYREKGHLLRYTYNNGSDSQSDTPRNLCIDDLGREEIPIMCFGTSANVMQQILEVRYELWRKMGLITHVTTNINKSQLTERYGAHVADRCREMFNVVQLTGDSKR